MGSLENSKAFNAITENKIAPAYYKFLTVPAVRHYLQQALSQTCIQYSRTAGDFHGKNRLLARKDGP